VTAQRVLAIIATVLFFLAWLVAMTWIDAAGAFWSWQSLVALGACALAARGAV
jgi:hypothetical protein